MAASSPPASVSQGCCFPFWTPDWLRFISLRFYIFLIAKCGRLRPGRAAMSLVLRNLQRAVPLRRAPLRRQVQALRGILGVREFDLGIICVDNKRMQRINRTYRGKDVPTDVLSFPFHENLEAGEIPQPDFADDYNLGDIFLGVEYIFQHCKENEDYYDILTVTATHGLCHLLGFTHSTEAAWQKMYQKEKQVLEELGRHTGARLQPLSRGLF
ncbi:PREDICTED: putative ribonuclease isoform X1 [Hipposideros armiger]|uniref:Ribonuclease isoform X1 n=2 Tax=Hipposideros armiger TaxID=186990 RepID=A0A8B7Q6P3_HIPAR|nr:PREDICTED: putative ribonuclease isoform X1 [Hipposideros armiger]